MPEIPTREPPRCILPGNGDWPRGLDELRRAPEELHVRGMLPTVPGLAIVGTRRADADALRFTRRLATAAVRAGRVVVSGGALGIDAAAHEGALDEGGATLAVLAGGVIQAYPSRHARLFARIVESGAVVSEHLDVAPHPGRFLARNRIIAALSEQVVVVQAPSKSGALSTAEHATEIDRPVWVVPASPWDPRGGGCLALLKRGARLLCDPSELFGGDVREREQTLPLASPEALAVWHALGSTPLHADELARTLKRDARSIQAALLELVLIGAAEERPGARFARASE